MGRFANRTGLTFFVCECSLVRWLVRSVKKIEPHNPGQWQRVLGNQGRSVPRNRVCTIHDDEYNNGPTEDQTLDHVQVLWDLGLIPVWWRICHYEF